MARSASLEVLLDHAQDKIVLLDDDGTLTYVNEAAERILGYDPEALVGQNAFEFVHPDDVTEVRAAFDRTIESATCSEGIVEYRHRRADGSWAWLESRMSNLTDSDLEGYVISSRDVTDRVEAERSHRETADRLEELAASAGDVLWMFDAEWTELLFVNQAFEDVFGLSIDELERDPHTFLDAIHPNDVPAVEEAMERLSAGETIDIEYRVNPSANYNRWVWVRGQPIVRDGEVVRVTGFSRDVTDRRRRKRQLYVMDNLLRHNLRNDINLILGYAELVEEEAPEVSDRTAVIRQTGENLLWSAEKERQIIDLLTTDPDHTRADLVQVARTSVESVQARFPECVIETSYPDEAPVFAVPEIGIALEELLENAIRHSGKDRPTVRVTVRTEEDDVEVAVDDTCPPIPEIEANVLTGGHEMNDVYHSTGLGLWLTYWTVDLSNGEISVDRRDRTGNRITVRLPRDSRGAGE